MRYPNKRKRLAIGVTCGVCLAMMLIAGQTRDAETQEGLPVTITIDAGKTLGPLTPIWRFFGADEPNYATMPDGRKLIGELGELKPGDVYFRAHNLMTTGDGTPALKWGSTNMYTEDAEGNPVYDWTIIDGIFDTYLKNGVKPYVQMGFMPEALSSKPQPYQHRWRVGAPYEAIFTGWAYPPKDYAKWGELCYRWAEHCAQRYGMDEVRTWYWQTWNEANAGYWQGSDEDYLKLHDYAVAGVRRAIPDARVGGADTAGDGGKFTRMFIEHSLHGKNYATGGTGTPIDFVSFHAKGSPKYVDGHVRMGIANQLRTIDRGFSIIASYPETKGLPIVIGESDPEGCAACQGEQLGYRNGTMYSSYTAASFRRKLDLAQRHGVNFQGALTWAFEFEGHPLFAGFRALASGGIDKPVLNVFRMMSKMTGERVALTSDHEVPLDAMLKDGVRGGPDVTGLASLDDGKLAVMIWHYHDDDVPGPDAEVHLAITGLPADVTHATLTHYRIDHDHSNAYTRWQKMGSPDKPTEAQYHELLEHDGLETLGDRQSQTITDGGTTLSFTLPRQGVSLLVLDWKK